MNFTPKSLSLPNKTLKSNSKSIELSKKPSLDVGIHFLDVSSPKTKTKAIRKTIKTIKIDWLWDWSQSLKYPSTTLINSSLSLNKSGPSWPTKPFHGMETTGTKSDFKAEIPQPISGRPGSCRYFSGISLSIKMAHLLTKSSNGLLKKIFLWP